MELLLSKLLPPFVYPLGLALELGLLAAFLLWRGRQAGLWLLLLALGLLWVAGTPIVSERLRASLEWRHLPLEAAASPDADAIVVLGGDVAEEAARPRMDLDLGGGVDKVRHAARLYHAGKAPLVIVSAGLMPWNGLRQPEARAITTLLQEWGVPARAILQDTASRTTRENALNTRALLDHYRLRRVLLVASAVHMPRALASFRGSGIQAIAAPTDFRVLYRDRRTLLDFLPSAKALAGTTLALHEYLGLLYYELRGWL